MSKSRWLCIPLMILWALSGARADVSEYRKADPRLEKKITLAVNDGKLEDVAQSLAEQSGVDIKAGTGKRDWKVRERKVTIQAKDIPVGQMLDEISNLTGFHVSREGKEGAWNYVIWQDQKARVYEEEMLTAAKEAEAQRAKDIRQQTLDAARDALNMSPADALKNGDKDPLTAYLGGTKPGRGMAQILSAFQYAFPIEYGLMMRGKKVSIPISSFPPDLQGAVADIMSGGVAAWFGKASQGQVAPRQFVVEGISGTDKDLQQMLGLGGLAYLEAQWPGQNNSGPAGIVPMASSDSKIGNLVGKLLLAVENGTSPDEAEQQLNNEFESPDGLAQLLARKSPTEENPPTDPDLTREIEIKETSGTFGPAMQLSTPDAGQGKMMAEIARASGKSVLLESYTGTLPLSMFIKKGKQPFYRILIAAEKAGCSWELGDGTLRIRPGNWPILRSKEVSESLLQYYRALLEKNGGFSLEDIAGLIASLTDAQMEGGLAADKELAPAVVTATNNPLGRNMLRAYGIMDTNQRAQLSAEGGLAFASLTEAEWDYINYIITDQVGGIQITDGSVRIVPDPPDKPNPNRKIFEISVLTPNEEKPRTIRVWVTTPTKAYVTQQLDMLKKQQAAMEQAAKDQAAKDQAAQQNKPK